MSSISSDRHVLRVFRGLDDPEACYRYLASHRRRLSSHAIGDLHSAQDEWIDDPFAWVVVVQDASGQLLAGCRLHVANGDQVLPMVAALREREPRLYERIHLKYPGPAAEIAGLWKTNGRGPSCSRATVVTVARTIFALANRLGVYWTWGLAPPHTLPLWRLFGVRVDRYVGDDGTFLYPDERFRSHVLHLNTRGLPTTPPDEKQRILELSARGFDTVELQRNGSHG